MDYFNIGDPISYNKYNALVYLLRRFKRLNSKLRLGQSIINDDYGTYDFRGGLESIEGNWILEDDVNIISNNCLLNCEYTFTFTIIDVNTSGIVNKREKSFSGLTGETGELNITIPEDTLNSDEQILSDFTVDIIFDEHEYYTPPIDINVALSVDKPYIIDGESATVTALITSDDGTPIESSTVNFNVNGTITSKTTDSTGKATLTITGDGTQGLLNINVLNETIKVIDAYFFDKNNNENWWNQYGDWNVTMIVTISGEFKRLLLVSKRASSYLASTAPSIDSEPPLNELLSLSTPFCVEFDTYTVNYPNIPSFVLWDTQGNILFNFQLYVFTHYKIQIEDNTIKLWKKNEYKEYSLEIPEELYVGFYSESNKFNAYVEFKDFMIYNISEPEPPVHDYSLSLTGTSIIQTGDNTTVTATLTDNGVAVEGETLDYEIKHGNTVISSGTTSATDSNGQATISYTGTGIGDVDIIVSKTSMSLQETCIIEDCYRYDLATSDKTSSYGSPITYRGSHSGTWNYNSSNGYYGTITNQDEVMIPFTELTGKDDFTIEFDAKLNYSTAIRGIAGICAYEDNNNYSRISCHAQKIAQRVSVNGSATESESDTLTTVNQGDVLHYKFTISNNQIVEEVMKGTTVVGTRTISYTPTNSTKYGFALVWDTGWVSSTYLKNIKIKPL